MNTSISTKEMNKNTIYQHQEVSTQHTIGTSGLHYNPKRFGELIAQSHSNLNDHIIRNRAPMGSDASKSKFSNMVQAQQSYGVNNQ